ncbi:MAG: 1-deoxy-D-xylulose-5-phosphate reductoisomerase [Planctomyces sp.]|nr:1-deoxy-D-xylulose-5-phosphate reductoisomerase [Planctomyces sp.]
MGTGQSSAGKQSIVVLGATGSIGRSCLDVIRQHRDRFQVLGLTAHRSAALLQEQISEFQPKWALLSSSTAFQELVSDPNFPGQLGNTELIASSESLPERLRSAEVDIVLTAVVGAAGLPATWAAVDAGKRVALANKEALVVAGPLIMRRAAETGAVIVPVDSEHSAIFQCMQAGRRTNVRRIVLTASGGPFRGWTRQEMSQVTPAMAMNHPTWKMGPKITVDSATMMNKALEIIEARWLFEVTSEQISVVIHPQSLFHSFVEYDDGSVISQISPPDMKLPIQYALTFPERLPCPCRQFDWTQTACFELHPPDFDAFPALRLGFEAATRGGTCGAVLNAANEVAVDRFLNGELRFVQIVQLVEEILQSHRFDAHPSMAALLQTDAWAREEAVRWN